MSPQETAKHPGVGAGSTNVIDTDTRSPIQPIQSSIGPRQSLEGRASDPSLEVEGDIPPGRGPVTVLAPFRLAPDGILIKITVERGIYLRAREKLALLQRVPKRIGGEAVAFVAASKAVGRALFARREEARAIREIPSPKIRVLAPEQQIAYDVMVEGNINRIFHYFRKRTYSDNDAHTLSTNLFLRALDHFPPPYVIDPHDPYGPWLFKIASNMMSNWWRDTARDSKRVVSLDLIDELVQLPDTGATVEDTVDEALLAISLDIHLLRRAILLLPTKIKSKRTQDSMYTLLWLKHIEHFDSTTVNKTIAYIMGLTESAVKARYNRLLRLLRKIVKDLEKQEPDKRRENIDKPDQGYGWT